MVEIADGKGNARLPPAHQIDYASLATPGEYRTTACSRFPWPQAVQVSAAPPTGHKLADVQAVDGVKRRGSPTPCRQQLLTHHAGSATNTAGENGDKDPPTPTSYLT